MINYFLTSTARCLLENIKPRACRIDLAFARSFLDFQPISQVTPDNASRPC